MLSLIRFPVLAKLALGGAAGSMLLAGAVVASPSVLAAAKPTATAPTTTTTTSKHHRQHDSKADRKLEIEAYLDASAAIMKMEPKDLRAALKSGRSLSQVAAEHGFTTKEAFADAVSKAIKPRLDAAVDAKKLTREQADHFQDRLAHGHLPLWERHHRK